MEDFISKLSKINIEDVELSDVFNLQLKALEAAILDKNKALKIIEKQNKKILETDKIKSEFLANISHELRTPLNAIIGFSTLLKNENTGKLNELQKDYLNNIHSSSIHLLGMINEILDISKIEAKTVKLVLNEFSPEEAIIEVINILKPVFQKKSVEIEFVSNGNVKIKADYQKFQQILFNLLSNAIKFSPEKEKVEIKTATKKSVFEVKITDKGQGIEKKYHKKIFNKFFQVPSNLKKSESSSGLGLTITKELIKLHKGKIFLESEKGKGAEFIVQLPLR